MSRTIRNLGETEWIVMRSCWKLGKTTARNVYEETQKYGKRSFQTIKTILDRLVEKDLLKREKLGPVWLYTPIASEEKTTSKAIDNFLNIVLGNKFTPIFMRLVKERKYANELEELKKMIENNKIIINNFD